MSTYREIVGKKIKKVSSDPSTGLDGQMWYNSTTGTLRGLGLVEAFVSSTNQPEAKRAVAGFGTQTALVVAAGVPPPGSASNTTIEYNGSGWFSGTNTPTSHYNSRGFGTQTAGAILGGVPDDATTFEYDGSSWTAGGEYPANINLLFTSGTQTAGIGAGGHPAVTTSNTYNGSSWTSAPAINTGRGSGSGAGTTSAMVIFGGGTGPNPGISNATEEYDSSSWTSVTNIPAATQFHGTAGTQTAAVYFGGSKPAVTNNSFTYDGSAFTAGPNLGTSRYTMATGTLGTQTAAICAGGFTGTANTAATEEYNRSTNTITAAAWASGGVLPAAWYGVGSSTNGTQDSAILFAGNNPGAFTGNTSSFEYDGNSWSADPSMSTARAYLAGFGTSTAAVGVGGLVPPGATGSNAVEEYTTSWTAGNTIPQAGWNQGACGTLTAGLVAFGTNPAFPGQYAKAFEYDGTNWTAANDAPTATNDSKGMGTQTSALFAGGGPPSPEAKQSYEYDGTNWTAGGSLSVDHKAGQTLGSSQNAGLIGGGHTSPQTAVEGYDGTAWSSRPSMATSRGRGGMSGTESAGVVAGGNPSATTATEEWTGETSTINIADFTTS